MKCENCTTEHDGSYGSGRFCSGKCARGFSTKTKREQINAAVSKRLAGVKHSEERNLQKVAIWARRTAGFLKELLLVEFNPLPYETKRIRVILEQKFCCALCGLSEWLGQPIVLELDHEDGNRKNNVRSNLRALCPNCHSTTPTWRGRKQAFVSSRMETLKRQKEIAINAGVV